MALIILSLVSIFASSAFWTDPQPMTWWGEFPEATPDYEFVHRMIQLTGSSCLFCTGFGQRECVGLGRATPHPYRNSSVVSFWRIGIKKKLLTER